MTFQHFNEDTNFLKRIMNLILEKKIIGEPNKIKSNNNLVINFVQPNELKKILNLSINAEKKSENDLFKLCEQVIQYEPITSHPNFYNQLYAGIDQYSLAGSWLTDALNTSIATYEISPVFSLMEISVINFLGLKIGWLKQNFDGIFSPGGSLSNIYGMLCARQNFFPQCKKTGIRHLKQLVLFVSNNSHYSYIKGAILLGLGSDAVIKVPTDNKGKMLVDKLDKLIAESLKKDQLPFMVGCTSGTTVLSAFDPLVQISKICKKYNLWMHVDGCLGSTVLLSSKHCSLMKGVEEADSVSWNLHKMAGAPLQSSIFLIKDKFLLKQAVSLNAEYLFQNDKIYDSEYDLGDKSIQCGRRVDSFKSYIMLASKGEIELERLVNKVFEVKDYFVNLIKTKKNFKLVLDEFEGITICFWYIPDKYLNIDWNKLEFNLINQICPKIKAKMISIGTLMINYQPISCKKLPNFFRMVLTCVPEPSFKEMDFVLDEIERIAKDIDF